MIRYSEYLPIRSWFDDLVIRYSNSRTESSNITEYIRISGVSRDNNIYYILIIRYSIIPLTVLPSHLIFKVSILSAHSRYSVMFEYSNIFEYIRWFGVCTSNLRIIESSNHRITEYLKLHRITEYRILANLTDIRFIEYRITKYQIIEYNRWTESPNIRSIESSNHRISNRLSNIYWIVRHPYSEVVQNSKEFWDTLTQHYN